MLSVYGMVILRKNQIFQGAGVVKGIVGTEGKKRPENKKKPFEMGGGFRTRGRDFIRHNEIKSLELKFIEIYLIFDCDI